MTLSLGAETARVMLGTTEVVKIMLGADEVYLPPPPPPPPENDNFADAIVLVSGVESVVYSSPATLEAGEPTAFDTGTLWWKFAITSGQTVNVVDASDTYDYLAVYMPWSETTPIVTEMSPRGVAQGRGTHPFTTDVDATYYLRVNPYVPVAGYRHPGWIRLTLTV